MVPKLMHERFDRSVDRNYDLRELSTRYEKRRKAAEYIFGTGTGAIEPGFSEHLEAVEPILKTAQEELDKMDKIYNKMGKLRKNIDDVLKRPGFLMPVENFKKHLRDTLEGLAKLGLILPEEEPFAYMRSKKRVTRNNARESINILASKIEGEMVSPSEILAYQGAIMELDRLVDERWTEVANSILDKSDKWRPKGREFIRDIGRHFPVIVRLKKEKRIHRLLSGYDKEEEVSVENLVKEIHGAIAEGALMEQRKKREQESEAFRKMEEARGKQKFDEVDMLVESTLPSILEGLEKRKNAVKSIGLLEDRRYQRFENGFSRFMEKAKDMAKPYDIETVSQIRSAIGRLDDIIRNHWKGLIESMRADKIKPEVEKFMKKIEPGVVELGVGKAINDILARYKKSKKVSEEDIKKDIDGAIVEGALMGERRMREQKSDEVKDLVRSAHGISFTPYSTTVKEDVDLNHQLEELEKRMNTLKELGLEKNADYKDIKGGFSRFIERVKEATQEMPSCEPGILGPAKKLAELGLFEEGEYEKFEKSALKAMGKPKDVKKEKSVYGLGTIRLVQSAIERIDSFMRKRWKEGLKKGGLERKYSDVFKNVTHLFENPGLIVVLDRKFNPEEGEITEDAIRDISEIITNARYKSASGKKVNFAPLPALEKQQKQERLYKVSKIKNPKPELKEEVSNKLIGTLDGVLEGAKYARKLISQSLSMVDEELKKATEENIRKYDEVIKLCEPAIEKLNAGKWPRKKLVGLAYLGFLTEGDITGE